LFVASFGLGTDFGVRVTVVFGLGV
jgi:hypothetical protein